VEPSVKALVATHPESSRFYGQYPGAEDTEGITSTRESSLPSKSILKTFAMLKEPSVRNYLVK
jgi:hypothetical protein